MLLSEGPFAAVPLPPNTDTPTISREDSLRTLTPPPSKKHTFFNIVTSTDNNNNSLPTDLTNNDSIDLEEDPSSSSSPSSSNRSPIYLRLDHIGKWESRLLMFTVWLLALFVVFLAVANVIASAMDGFTVNQEELDEDSYYMTNAIGAIVCLTLLLFVGIKFSWRCFVVSSYRQNRKWDSRRKAFVIDAAVLLVLGILNAVFWLTPHAIGLAKISRCTITKQQATTLGILAIFRYTAFSLIMIWSLIMISNMCIHTPSLPVTRKNADYLLKLDQPWKRQLAMHKWKLLFWVLLEVLILVMFVNMFIPREDDPGDDTDCASLTSECENVAAQVVSAVAQCVLVAVVILAYSWYLVRAIRDHRKLPYMHYKLTNLWLRIAKRHTTVLFLSIFVGVILVELVTQGNCIANVQVKLGSFTVNVALSVYVLYAAILYMPSTLTTTPVQALKQNFAWTEASLETALTLRDNQLRVPLTKSPTSLMSRMISGPILHIISKEKENNRRKTVLGQPMFCLETSLRLMYWTRLAYQHKNPGTIFTVQDALDMYQLRHFDCIEEPLTDSKVLLGWNDSVLVVAFRGTKSFTNIVTDAKAWNTQYIPREQRSARSSQHVWRQARVHTGFLAAWQGAGFHDKFLNKVSEIFNSDDVMKCMRILVCGHSLGGALAMLAAFEIAIECPEAVDVVCYTYGAPRLGNRAFTHEYNHLVPNTFNLVHQHDPIPRIPKGTYKRSGVLVALAPKGDVVVAPTYFETTLFGGSASMKAHRTASYDMALAKFIKSQFSPLSRIPGGKTGALDLVRTVDVGKALTVVHVDLESLQNDDIEPVSVLPVDKERKVMVVEEAVMVVGERKSQQLFTSTTTAALESTSTTNNNDGGGGITITSGGDIETGGGDVVLTGGEDKKWNAAVVGWIEAVRNSKRRVLEPVLSEGLNEGEEM